MGSHHRAPSICGALGSYDRERVLRIARGLDGQLRPVHEDHGSMLMLDREPIGWCGPRERGVGWIEGDFWRGGASEWREAAQRGACGLVIRGRRRFVHSAINGLAPVYWTDDGSATYFASRIDPLATTSSGLLSVDWDAWAAIIALRFPLGDRTPFAEIRRLGPFSTLRRRFGRARRESPAWPWAEIGPTLDPEAAAGDVVDALREALDPLEGPVVCPLSGGRDSRILLCVLVERKELSPVAVTVSNDDGDRLEEGLAAQVAAALGVPHERRRGRSEEYPRDWEERAYRAEHQYVDHAWLVPLARRLEGVGAPVPDGFALDVGLSAGGHFFSPEVLDHRRRGGASRALFDSMRRYGLAHRALQAPFHEPIVTRARDQFLVAAKPFHGHPSQAVLTFYATRSVRGTSSYPSGLLGRGNCVLTPGVRDEVFRAMLRVRPTEKVGGRVYRAVYDHLAPPIAHLPSTADTARQPTNLPRRWRSDTAVETYRRLLANGPLAPFIAPELRAWLDAPTRGELSGDLRIGMEALSLFHSWWGRYRHRLREVDGAELRGA